MSEALRRLAGAAWAFRERVEREATKRFARLAAEIARFDPESPVVPMLLRASVDERRHAGLCAELAASYGAPAGEEPPEVRIAPARLGPRDAALYEMVAACCITETESVATVATLLAGDAEPHIRTVLHEIARDEVVHSRMGWSHLAREAGRGDVSYLARWIPAMLNGAADPALFAEASAAEEPEGLTLYGLLPRARRREIFVRTLEQVVLPGLEMFGVDPAPARGWLAQRRGQGARSR